MDLGVKLLKGKNKATTMLVALTPAKLVARRKLTMSSRTQIPRNQGILHFACLRSRALKESMIFEAKLEAGFLAGKRHIIPALLASSSHERENLQMEMGSQTPCSAKKNLRRYLRWP
jgi:hypothetical protein